MMAIPQGKSDDTGRLMKEAESLFENGQLELSAARFQSALSRLEIAEVPDVEAIMRCLSQLGAIYFSIQEYGKAIEVYISLVETCEMVRGPDDVESISAIYRLGKACEKSGQRDDAQALYGRAKSLAGKVLPEQHYLLKNIRESYNSSLSSARIKQSFNDIPVFNPQEQLLPPVNTQTIERATRKIITRKDMVLRLFLSGVGVAGIAAVFFMYFKMPESPKLPSPAQVQEAPDLRRDQYESAGGQIGLAIKQTVLAVESPNRKITIPYVALKDGPSAFGQVLEHILARKQIWIARTDDMLRLEDGSVFYSLKRPEVRMFESVVKVAQEMNSYYAKNHGYIDEKKPWVADITYTNPYDGRPYKPTLNTFSRLTKLEMILDGATTESEFLKAISTGGAWRGEPTMTSGAMHMVSMYGNEKYNNDYVVTDLYLKAGGANGAALAYGPPGVNVAMHLKKGRETPDSEQMRKQLVADLEKKLTGDVTFVYKDGDPVSLLAWMRFVVPGFLCSMLFISAIWWLMSEDAKGRVEDMRAKLKPSEISTLILAILTITWFIYVSTVG